MPWFNVDDGFANSKPVLRIPRRYRCAAIGLWTPAGSWSAKELTDGFIPDHCIEEFASTEAMAEMLVRAELWRKVAGGWQFEGWSKWQKTKEKVLAYREREAEKKRSQRSSTKPAAQEGVSPGDSPGTETRVPEGQHRESPICPAPPLPLPLPKPKPREKDLRDADASSEPTPISLESTYPKAFEQWWEHYPLKTGKRKALDAWKRARRRATDEQLIEGAKRYGADPNRKPDFTKYPEGWLNRDGWLDEPLPGDAKSNAGGIAW